MGKFNNRIMAIIFMACWCSMVYTGDWRPEHRGMGIKSSNTSWGKVIFFVLYVLCNELGDHLDEHPMGDYACPSYCDADHIHIRRSHEGIIPTDEKPNQETDPKLRGSIVLADRE